MNIKKAGIICHPEVEERELVEKIIEKLQENDIEIFFDNIIAGKINACGTRISEMDIDLALIIGGDGTILWTLKELKHEPLILSVNAGRFGFLSELKRDNAIEGLNLVLSGKFKIDSRTKIKINDCYEALNEAAILPEKPGTLLEFEIKLNEKTNKNLDKFRADGVIVSTQTGSTAYNLSAGGSIIGQGAKVFAITPINPFMNRRRSVIVPDDTKISIKLIRKDRNAQLLCDGIFKTNINSLETVGVKKSRRIVRFVRFG
ncbi:hypothetical protein BEH94_00315 [Candidatus Altiarchaeales archaeon WOR_SM1_SCG]|nr:hypothetical protein BEH94_00315 [Candidatus Altiarchaeales archaeon WOR_SM1_SCG]